jgi:hypothetical protein
MAYRKLFAPFLAALIVCPLCSAQETAIAEAVAEPSPANATAPATEATAKPTLRPITVAVTLIDDNSTITGTLVETNSISIKTAFGLAELPLSEVAGVKFPRGEDSATTVVMLNGDSITGATDVKFANVETTWGNARINGQSIASMLMVPGLAWQLSDVLGSKRWQLVEAPRTSSAAPGRPGQPLPAGSAGQPSQAIRPGASSGVLPLPGPINQPTRIGN